MVDALHAEYSAQGKPVVWIEHNADDCRQGQPCVGSAGRAAIFWLAHGPRAPTEYLPLLMADSGATFYNGSSTNWNEQLRSMVDTELLRPAEAELVANYTRQDITATVHVEVTNRSDAPLGQANRAQLWVVLYEDAHVIHTGRYVRAVKAVPITSDLAVDATATYEVTVASTGDMDWARGHVLVFVDRQPVAGQRYDMLQAALAIEGPPATREPTATATATAIPWPTDTPVAWPTDRPMAGGVYLPVLHRNGSP